MEIVPINWLAVFATSLTSFAIGALWFGPKTFYPIWIRALGREVPTERIEMSGGETATMFGGTYLAGLVQVTTLAVVINYARLVLEVVDAGVGAQIGLAMAVGFGAFASLSHRMFGQPDHKVYRSLKVWIIEVGQDVVALTVAGAILGAWV